MLVPEERPATLGRRTRVRAWRGGVGGVSRTSTRQDGTFSIANVTPGSTPSSRAPAARTSGGGSRTASQPLVVAGEEVNVVLTPAPGVVLSGSVTFESAGTPTPTSFAGFRVNPIPLGSAVAMARMVRPAEASESGPVLGARRDAGPVRDPGGRPARLDDESRLRRRPRRDRPAARGEVGEHQRHQRHLHRSD